jgi:hypothetical protein
MQTAKQVRLPLHEWLVIGVGALLLGVLSVVVSLSDDKVLPERALPQKAWFPVIEVFVEGAIEGSERIKVIVPHGASVQDVLDHVSLAADADLRRIKPTKKVRNGQILKIPSSQKKRKK